MRKIRKPPPARAKMLGNEREIMRVTRFSRSPVRLYVQPQRTSKSCSHRLMVICLRISRNAPSLTAFLVIKSLFGNPELSAPLHSLIARIITSVLVTLPRISPSSISQDLGFIHILNFKIQDFSLTIGSGTTSVMSKTLPFVIESALTARDLRVRVNRFHNKVQRLNTSQITDTTRHRPSLAPSSPAACPINATS